MFLFYSSGHHRDLHSFPTRRSSDLRHLQPDSHGVSLSLEVYGCGGCPPAESTSTSRTPNSASQSMIASAVRSEEHTSELQSRPHLVCRLLLEKKKKSLRSSTSLLDR